MTCCECDKPVDIRTYDVPPKWYGKYEGDKLVQIICADCIEDEDKLKRWREMKKQ